MKQISIGASNHIDIVKTKLACEFKELESSGLKFSIKENTAGNYVFLSCSLSLRNSCSEKDAFNICKHYIAEILSDLIMDKWRNSLMVDIIRDNYYYLAEEDRRVILENALGYLEGNTGTLFKIRKKKQIKAKLKDLFSNYDQIVIDGFIRFRLKEYIKELQEAADKAVDDFLMDREYKEFIQLLKYFVDIQDTHFEKVNVILKPNGIFKLYDQHMKEISNTYMDSFIVDLLENEINYEDLLISALITLAPKEIIFHSGEEIAHATLETIKSIFTHRVLVCGGCELCR